MFKTEQGLRAPVTGENEIPTHAYGTLTTLIEKAVEHIRVVDSRYISSVTVSANLDVEGNICKEETGILITISAR